MQLVTVSLCLVLLAVAIQAQSYGDRMAVTESRLPRSHGEGGGKSMGEGSGDRSYGSGDRSYGSGDRMGEGGGKSMGPSASKGMGMGKSGKGGGSDGAGYVLNTVGNCDGYAFIAAEECLAAATSVASELPQTTPPPGLLPVGPWGGSITVLNNADLAHGCWFQVQANAAAQLAFNTGGLRNYTSWHESDDQIMNPFRAVCVAGGQSGMGMGKSGMGKKSESLHASLTSAQASTLLSVSGAVVLVAGVAAVGALVRRRQRRMANDPETHHLLSEIPPNEPKHEISTPGTRLA